LVDEGLILPFLLPFFFFFLFLASPFCDARLDYVKALAKIKFIPRLPWPDSNLKLFSFHYDSAKKGTVP